MSSNKLVTPLTDLEVRDFIPGQTVRDLYEAWDIPASKPVMAFVNGEAMMRDKWDIPLFPDEEVVFMLLPMGGDEQDKAIMRTVAMIALTVATASLTLPEALSAWQVAAVRAGVAIAGSFLINELIPIVTEDPSTDERKSLARSSTYSVSAQGNRARLLEPIPAVYGRHQYFPDYVSQPYGEYEDNFQVLFQHYSLGVVDADIEKLAFGGVAIWDEGAVTNALEDVEIEFVEPGETSDLYPETNVTSDSVSSFDVTFKKTDNIYDITGGAVARITTDSASGGNNDLEESLSIWAVGDIVRVVDITGAGANGGSTADNVRYEVVAVASDGDWIDVQAYDGAPNLTTEVDTRYILDEPREERSIGPFPASAAGEETRTITVNLAFPRGLYRLTGNNELDKEAVSISLYAQRIDDAGNKLLRDGSALGTDEFLLDGNRIFEDTSTAPLFKTLKYPLDNPGRYEVRAVREDREEGLVDNRRADAIVWQTLGGVLTTETTYPIRTLVVKIRATNQLSEEASQKLAVTQTAKVPVYNEEDQTWTVQATRNPVWAMLDMLRNTDYGGGVPDSRLDLSTFVYYADLADTNGDTFNAVFDTKRSLWESVGFALRAMRAFPVLLGDTYSMTRDEDQQIPKAVFTPRNIVRDSFNVSHKLFSDESPDHVIVEYIDEDVWDVREVACTIDGDTSDYPARIRLFGVTNRDQAFREGSYYVRANRYRRITVAFETELDGRVLLRGDRILVSHDLHQWGQSSEVVSYDSGTRVLTLNDEVVFGEGEHVISITEPDGSEFGPVVCTQNDKQSVILDATSLAAAGDIDAILTVNNVARERNRVTFGTTSTYSKIFQVTDVRPKDLQRVEVVAVNYDSRIGLDPGLTPDADSGNGPGPNPDQPVIDALYVTQTSNTIVTPVEVQATWTAARGADFYQLQYSYDNATWYTAYEGSDTTAALTVQPGTVYFRVAGFGFLRGPYTTTSQTFVRAGTIPVGTGDSATSTYEDRGSMKVTWPKDPSADYYKVTLYSGSDSLTVETSDVGIVIEPGLIADANGPWSQYNVDVVAVNEKGEAAAGSTSGSIVLSAPTNLNIENDWEGPDHSILATWEPLPQFNSYTVQVYLGGVLQDTYTVYSPHFFLPAQKVAEYTLARSLEIRVSANAGTIITGLATDTVTDSAPSVPSNITTSSASAGKLVVSWDALSADDLRYYRLYAAASSGFTPGASNLAYEGTNNSVTINGLPSGATIYMQLVAVDYIESGLNYSTEFSQLIT